MIGVPDGSMCGRDVLGLVLIAGTAIEHAQMQHHHGLDNSSC